MPRLGIGIPLVATATEAPALSIQDFFWLNDISSELTPIHTASRTNLVPNTSANGMTGTGVTISSSIGPNGTNNGIKMTETSATSQHYKGFGGISVVAGLTYAISYFIKKGTYDSVVIFTNTAQINSNATINFANETITVSGSNLISNSKFIRNEGNGWYRVGYAAVADATGNTVLYTAVKSLVVYEGNTSNFTEFFGPQVEQDSRASAHIPTSGSAVTVATALNDTHDTWDYDSADLMLEADPDSEGVWERPSNIVLNHDYADLGAEEITNGDFATDLSGWTLAGTNATNTITWETNGARIISTNVNIALSQNTLIVGKTYRLTCDVAITFGKIGLDGISIANGNTVNLVEGFNEITFVADSTTLKIKRVVANSNCLLDNVSVKEVDPNARWTKAGLATIENGVAKFLDDGTNTNSSITQGGFPANTTYELVFAITRYVAGRIQVLISSDSYNVDISGGVGTYTVIIQPSGSTSLTIKRDGGFSGFDFDIDNVTLKEYAITPLDV